MSAPGNPGNFTAAAGSPAAVAADMRRLWRDMQRYAMKEDAWRARLDDAIAAIVAAALEHLQIDDKQFSQLLQADKQRRETVFQFAFEQFALEYDKAHDSSFAEYYLARHGNNASPQALQTIQTLAQTPPQLLRVVNCSDDSLQLIAPAENNAGDGSETGDAEDSEMLVILPPPPSSQGAHGKSGKIYNKGEYLFARVFKLGAHAYLGAAVLILPEEAAFRAERLQHDIKEELSGYFQRMRQDNAGEEDINQQQLQAFIQHSTADDMPRIAFNLWAEHLLLAADIK